VSRGHNRRPYGRYFRPSLGKEPEKISEYRTKVKQHVAPNQELLDRYTSRFLMGKASGIKIDELLTEIEKSYL